ncbi:MAG: HAD family phosphatase [Lachnospiraceae bacterium]|nr:HAD family phosphatase [Lachnospiraceae bacterium]
MIKNIVFDMGNVLTIYNARDYIYGYVDNEEDFIWMKNHLCASVEWLKMDRGTIKDDEAIRSVCKRIPERLHSTVERFVREYRMVQPPNPPMEELVEELSQNGYGLYLMSNTSHRFRIFSQSIKSIAYMKGIWISCEHGLLKPEPAAYLDFFQTFSLKPEECFFIDDTPANIEAAGNLGMDGCVYYGDVAELRHFLYEKNIKIRIRNSCKITCAGDAG